MKKKNRTDASAGLSRRGFFTATAGGAAAALLRVPANAASAPVPGSRQYRIHPAIGVARVGNADPSTYFTGPEVPGYAPLDQAPGTPSTPKKVNGLVKPQGARFRIWEYAMDSNGNWQPTQEMNLSTAN